MNLFRRYPITAFFILTFAISWGIRIPMGIASIDAAPLKLLAEFGPAIAALIVTAALNGKSGVRTLLGGMRKWRVNPWWFVLVLLGPVALQLISIGAFVLFGGPGAQFQFPGLVLPVILTIGFILSVGEEIGWRGFALPRLQSRTNPLAASLILGVFWAVWHVPGDLSVFISNPGLLASSSTYIAFLWFMGLTVTGSVLMAWVYNRTGGSLLLMALFHMSLTVLWQFTTLPERVDQFGPAELSTVLMGIVALVVVLTGMQKASQEKQTQKHFSPDLSLVEAQGSSR